MLALCAIIEQHVHVTVDDINENNRLTMSQEVFENGAGIR